ncbi:MAG: SigB/SigF/SigG family RNA polymerase sigma factor [Acidimicrobiales bacterium]
MTDTRDEDETAARFEEFAETRSKSLRNRLVEDHMGLAVYLARRFVNRGVNDDDLRQVAMVALVKAVDRFDPTNGAAFSTFAGRTIEGEIKRHFRDKTWAVRVPRSLKEIHLHVRSAVDELGQELGRSPTPKEIAAHLDVDLDTVIGALSASAAHTANSLDTRIDPDMPTDRTAALSQDDRGYVETEARLAVAELLEQLPEREQEIVRLRFMEGKTQTEIAEVVGISQMHVSRLLRRAIEAMRTDAVS